MTHTKPQILKIINFCFERLIELKFSNLLIGELLLCECDAIKLKDIYFTSKMKFEKLSN
jgi:hypothetical protein